MLAPPTAAPPPQTSVAPPVAPPRGANGTPRPFTVAELAERFGSLPAWRVHNRPAPGTGTRADADRLRTAGALCELVDGTLIEKAVSEVTSFIAARLIRFLSEAVEDPELGWVLGADNFVDLYGGTLQRAPDVSVVLDEQRPNGLAARGWGEGAPALCVEAFSPSNTLAEMRRKRAEYFDNGCRCVWVVYPGEAPAGRANTAEVYLPGDADDPARVVRDGETLDGEPVLPGFAVPLARVLRRGA